MMNLNNQIKFYLEFFDMTAAQLARKAKVPKSNISEWMTGRKPKDLEQLKRCADVFSTSLDNLCFGDGLSKERNSFFDEEDEWISGIFEVKVRRLKGVKK